LIPFSLVIFYLFFQKNISADTHIKEQCQESYAKILAKPVSIFELDPICITPLTMKSSEGKEKEPFASWIGNPTVTPNYENKTVNVQQVQRQPELSKYQTISSFNATPMIDLCRERRRRVSAIKKRLIDEFESLARNGII